MKLLITFFFCLFFSKSQSQTNNIKYIHFHNHNSIIVKSDLDVYIFQINDSVNVYIKTHESEKNYSIPNEKLLKLSNAILKINPKDIMQDVRTCLDAGETEINFSSTGFLPQNLVTYKVSCLSQEDNKTIWKEYLNAVNLILEIAKLKLSDLE